MVIKVLHFNLYELFILIERKFARLGEHDLRNGDDGAHQDIPIARAVGHVSHDPVWKLNDIAILHLERDVEFSGGISNDFFLSLQSF